MVEFERTIRQSGPAYVVTIPKQYIENGILRPGKYRFKAEPIAAATGENPLFRILSGNLALA